MTTLLETITDRALKSFGDVNKDNWEEWVDHWIATGDKFHEELESEGLTITAQLVQKHIDFIKKIEGRT